jgi:hypothetical protein
VQTFLHFFSKKLAFVWKTMLIFAENN